MQYDRVMWNNLVDAYRTGGYTELYSQAEDLVRSIMQPQKGVSASTQCKQAFDRLEQKLANDQKVELEQLRKVVDEQRKADRNRARCAALLDGIHPLLTIAESVEQWKEMIHAQNKEKRKRWGKLLMTGENYNVLNDPPSDEVIRELFNGCLDIQGTPHTSPEYRAELQKYINMNDAFVATLSAQQKQEYNAIADQHNTLSQISCSEIFIRAFKFGVRLAIDALDDDIGWPAEQPDLLQQTLREMEEEELENEQQTGGGVSDQAPLT